MNIQQLFCPNHFLLVEECLDRPICSIIFAVFLNQTSVRIESIEQCDTYAEVKHSDWTLQVT